MGINGFSFEIRICPRHERIVGDSAFVQNALNDDSLDISKSCQLQQAGWTLEKLIERVCGYFDVEQNQLAVRVRHEHVVEAKAVIAHLATQELRIPSIEISNRFKMSRSGIYDASRRMLLDN